MKDKRIRVIDFLYKIYNHKVNTLDLDVFITNLPVRIRLDLEKFINENKNLGIF